MPDEETTTGAPAEVTTTEAMPTPDQVASPESEPIPAPEAAPEPHYDPPKPPVEGGNM